MVIYNQDATFDVDGVNEGIIDVKLYLDEGDDAFDADTDTLIAQTADNTVTFNSTTTATIDFSAIDNNSINFSNTENYF